MRRDKIDLIKWVQDTEFDSFLDQAFFKNLVRNVTTAIDRELAEIELTRLYRNARVYCMSKKYNLPDWKIWEKIRVFQLAGYHSKMLWVLENFGAIRQRAEFSFLARAILVHGLMMTDYSNRQKLDVLESIDEYRRMYG